MRLAGPDAGLRDGAMAEIRTEHAVLVRQLGRLQQHMDGVVAAHGREVARLQAQVLRLRAQLVLNKTRMCWGMGQDHDLKSSAPTRRVTLRHQGASPGVASAMAVLCQTGCVGHAHAWLNEDLGCRLNGQACVLLAQGQAPSPEPAGSRS